MATTRISHSLPPNIDVTKAPLAFGNRALPKLNRELKDVNLITRQRALMTLCDLVHDPEKVYQAIGVGCIQSLKDLLTDLDSTVRHKATEVLYITASHNVGRDAFLKHKVIQPVAMLFDDEVELVRRNAHKAIKMMSEIPSGAAGVVDANLIPKLVYKLEVENETIQYLILTTLHFCARVDPITALRSGIMPVLKDLLTHDNELVRCGAARVLMDVSVPLLGKNIACEDSDVVPLLVQLLTDSNNEVKANAAGAIMTIAVTTKGKYTAIEAGAMPNLLRLVNSTKTETRLNAIKALTMLAEAPEGREDLLGHAGDMEDRICDPDSKSVAHAAEIAVRVITWKP